MMRRDRVPIAAGFLGRVGVDGGIGEPVNMVEKPVTDVLGDVVSL